MNLLDGMDDMDAILFSGDMIKKRNDIYETENTSSLMKRASEIAG